VSDMAAQADAAASARRRACDAGLELLAALKALLAAYEDVALAACDDGWSPEPEDRAARENAEALIARIEGEGLK